MAELSSSIYQFLNPRDVTPLDPFGAMEQGQRSAFGQMALQEARREQQQKAQVEARLRQAYAQGGTGAPQPGMLPMPGAPGAPGAVQETVNTPYSSDLQNMLSQYQGEGADVTPTPGARTLPGGGLPGAPGQGPMARMAAPQGGNVLTPAVIRDIGMIDPQAAMAAQKYASESQKSQLEMHGKQAGMVAQVARGILLADTQAAYEQGVNYLRSMGIPVDHLPQYYDRRLVETYYHMGTDGEARVKEAQARLYSTQAELEPQKLALEERQETRLGVAEQRLQKQYELDVDRYGTEQARLLLEQRKQRLTEEETAQAVPKYTGDSTLNVAIDQVMKERGLTGQPPADVLGQAQKNVQEGKVRVSRSQGEAAALAKPLEGPALQRVNTLMQGEDVVKALQTEFTPEERRKYVGLGGLRMSAQEAQQLLADATAGKADPKFARFAALVALGKQEAFSTAGQALSGHERDVVFGYIPTGREWSSEEFEQKLTLSGQRLPTLIDRELTLSTTPREQLAERRKRGELPSLSPGSPTAAPLKEFTEADIAEAMRQTKRSRAEVLDLARKTKKYRVPAQ